ncbi:MAG: lamin tail domain-containing protein, partial [Thermoanaerobaculia bacterium]
MPSPSRVSPGPVLRLALALAVASWPGPRGGAQEAVISEFLALNGGAAGGGLRDDDGDSSDWVEIRNRGAALVDLGGWFLTDDPALPGKWRFPPHLLPAGGFLVVFASGKDRAGPAPPFHTSFRLDGGGEYLALVRPDGSLAHDYAPAYPRQFEDVSYGLFEDARTAVLLGSGAPARFLVPRDGSLGLRWTEPDFDDASWTPARNGLGFEAPGDVPVETQPTNLALDGSPSQSSTLGGFVADLAIDGDRGNFTHTAAGS